MKIIKDVLVIVALLTACACGYQAWHLLAQAETTLNGIGERTEATLRTANRVLLSVGGSAAEMRKTAQEQRKLLQQTTQLTNDRLAQFGAVLTKLDARVNDELLPMVTAAVKANGEASVTLLNETTFALRMVQADVHDATVQLTATAAASQATIEQVNVLLGDPSIPATLKNVEGTTNNIEGITKNVQAATKPAKIWMRAMAWIYEKVTAGLTAW